MNAEQRATLWARLAGAGVVSGEPPLPRDARSPWFVRVILGVAGWIGALFLLGLVGAGLAFLIKSSAAAWVAGAGACLAAATLFRANKGGDFTAQFGLAVSLAGQCRMGFGLGNLCGKSFSSISLALAVQQAVLFFLVPNFVHRVWTAWTGAALLLTRLALHRWWPLQEEPSGKRRRA
jgi:hypothetical protein